jgi:hypothetical protein
MQSSSNKIILILYKLHIREFYYKNYRLADHISSLVPFQTIIRIYISSIKSEYVIIEVILKDQCFSTERYHTV